MYEAGLVLQLQHLFHNIETKVGRTALVSIRIETKAGRTALVSIRIQTKAGRTALVSIHIVIENLTYDWQPE